VFAGFVEFPGTFTSIGEALREEDAIQNSDAARNILESAKNIPLLVIAAICSGVGALGMLWLSFRWRRNYVWLLNCLYLSGIMSCLAGMISTLIRVYAQKGGSWSITAKITAIVEGAGIGV
jgi:hypothetical protein